MPPVKYSPGSFFAEKGSEEHIGLVERLGLGEFGIVADIESPGLYGHQLFIPPNSDPTEVIASLVMQTGESIYAPRITGYNVADLKQDESRESKVAKFLSRLFKP